MDGILIIDGLMLVFGGAIAITAVWFVLRLRATAPIKLQHRINLEVAERRAAMAAMAAAYTAASPEQRERLALNYRYNRAAVLALDPEFDASTTDAVFAARAPTDRIAA